MLLEGWVVTAILLAAAKVMVNAGDVSTVVLLKEPWVNRITLLVPTRFTDKPENVTTPLEAATVVVPPTEPSPVWREAVTESELSVTTLPNSSWIFTTGCWENATPATVLLEGSVVTTILFADAKVMVNAGDVSVVVLEREAWVKRKTLFVPATSMDNPE